ncbi:magnesium and cobalt transport protein CorA [Streptomyces clavuligerus]|uniref:Metal-transport protein n=2 Tax=Streptomyces clavuligerus TaxID=1901 RepID=E2PVE6_STRCL|nr:magnesium and cobalt transport protein CorA [Streptomyces clavuligerus]ANW21942.1 magnesium transporter CorA [Streptomyces clavuligerus]AXU16566.1 magnesium and cobalt transport protein CorA [Streptomyces clavuligerus]EFG07860.1 Metal-transport protein [Streptomyces clavuligerus]MBY6303935.1 magnesium and cobalt transport protein CorA [Streptomyces clavuligerus]QCS09328.1 magnesium and cobalt transport protein CorA [Streptomyces clavuligerus]
MIRRLRRAMRRAYRRPTVDLSHPARSPLGSSVVNCVVYEDGVRRPCTGDAHDALREVRKQGRGFVWIGLHEPTHAEFAVFAALFGLHPLAVEDAVQAHQRPKVQRYELTEPAEYPLEGGRAGAGVLFTVLKTCRYVGHERGTSEIVDTGELMVFTGPDFVITVRHGRHGSLGPLREALEERPERLAKGPAAVLHAIADHVVDDYLAVADAVQDDVDDAENAVFGGHPRQADVGQIHLLKRELLELRRAVGPLERPIRALASSPLPSVGPQIRPYFRDVADHVARVNDQIGTYDSLLDSILQAHLAQVTVAQNEDMRKITAWAAIVAVPTMVCGVYGMNFDHMPELRWTYGYPLVIGVMVTACALIHRSFRRNGWL